jgi:hypothetical protein
MQSNVEKQAEFLRDADRPLQEAVDSFHDWLLAIGSFLEQVEVVLGRLSCTPTDSLVMSDVGKVGVSGAGLDGCFSPCTRVSSAITALVMQIMPEEL